MFEKLQKKWKVGGWQLLLILCTFAIGGSATGYVGKKIMNVIPVDKGILWTLLYIIIVTLIWPLAVLLVSIPFGQFRFFVRYLQKMGQRMRIYKPRTGSTSAQQLSEPFKQIAIFASGTGTNAQKIIEYFGSSTVLPKNDEPKNTIAKVALVASNKPDAGVLKIAEKENVPILIIEKEKFFRGNAYADELKQAGIDFIVLAGFLWKIPQPLIDAYRNRIINIHPALLPKHGGKGMYGSKVHEAVLAAQEKESGITIHYVDEHYDNGDVIFQAYCTVDENDTPESLAQKIHQLEHEHFPRVIERVLKRIVS